MGYNACNDEIRDNGMGLPEGITLHEGIGLSTTKARLERLYGARHELALTNLPDGGCVARILIPFQPTSDDRHDSTPELAVPAPLTSPVVIAGD